MSVKIILLLIVVLSSSYGADVDSVKKVVKKFIDMEFNYIDYNEYSNDVIRYTKPKNKNEDNNFYPVFNKYILVKSYNILDVSVKERKGSARISYERIGRSLGQGKIIKEVLIDTIKLNLKNIRGKWFVYDPTIPRVSLNATIQCFESELSMFENLKNPSEYQLEIAKERREQIKYLNSLSQ